MTPPHCFRWLSITSVAAVPMSRICECPREKVRPVTFVVPTHPWPHPGIRGRCRHLSRASCDNPTKHLMICLMWLAPLCRQFVSLAAIRAMLARAVPDLLGCAGDDMSTRPRNLTRATSASARSGKPRISRDWLPPGPAESGCSLLSRESRRRERAYSSSRSNMQLYWRRGLEAVGSEHGSSQKTAFPAHAHASHVGSMSPPAPRPVGSG